MILDINKDNIDLLRQGANLLLNDMKDFSAEFCPTFEAAMEKMQRCACDERICRGYVDETGTLLGWIGAIEQYIRTGWELHPLIVKRDARKRGIGSALIRDLENTIRSRGGITIYLGTDDEHNRTTLSGVDLYTDLWDKVRNIRNHGGHPYEFYQKMGYSIVGVIPDANGIGKPDIWMAKRIG